MESDPAATITDDAGMIDLAENSLFSSLVTEASPRIAKCACSVDQAAARCHLPSLKASSAFLARLSFSVAINPVFRN